MLLEAASRSSRCALGTVLLWLATGCAALRGGASDADVAEACHDAESAEERAAVEGALSERTRVAVRAHAVSSDELAARTGVRLYDDDVVLMAYDALDHGHPCCSTTTEVTLASDGVDWQPLRGGDLWRHAGLEPPVPARLDPKFSASGFGVDLFVMLLTLGEIDPNLRGTDHPVLEPGRPGTGNAAQTRAARIHAALDGTPTLPAVPNEIDDLE